MTRYIVAAYDADIARGGPEEGGWYYNVGTLVRILKTFSNQDKAYAYARRLNRSLGEDRPLIGPNVGKREISSVLSEGRIQAEVHEDVAPAGYPDQRPRYE